MDELLPYFYNACIEVLDVVAPFKQTRTKPTRQLNDNTRELRRFGQWYGFFSEETSHSIHSPCTTSTGNYFLPGPSSPSHPPLLAPRLPPPSTRLRSVNPVFQRNVGLPDLHCSSLGSAWPGCAPASALGPTAPPLAARPDTPLLKLSAARPRSDKAAGNLGSAHLDLMRGSDIKTSGPKEPLPKHRSSAHVFPVICDRVLPHDVHPDL
nr:uncharacterized protein LOC133572572 [Nerophis lumbriciformis]